MPTTASREETMTRPEYQLVRSDNRWLKAIQRPHAYVGRRLRVVPLLGLVLLAFAPLVAHLAVGWFVFGWPTIRFGWGQPLGELAVAYGVAVLVGYLVGIPAAFEMTRRDRQGEPLRLVGWSK